MGKSHLRSHFKCQLNGSSFDATVHDYKTPRKSHRCSFLTLTEGVSGHTRKFDDDVLHPQLICLKIATKSNFRLSSNDYRLIYIAESVVSAENI